MRNLKNRPRDEQGTVAVLTAISVVVLLVTAAFAVDIGNTWARRGMLQKQADQAALFAAQYLPATGPDEQLQVAKAVGYYLTCHPVAGQSEIDPSIPDCPSSPESTDAEFSQYAGRLLGDGNVTFPTTGGSTGSYVKVLTPAARVDFGLGAVAGPTGSVQAREATARIGSPGSVAPMALSLNCMLTVADKLPEALRDQLGGALPMNYMSGDRTRKPATDSEKMAEDLLGCARMIKSPRGRQLGTGDNLDLNLIEGLDHALGMHPTLGESLLQDPLDAAALLGAVGGGGGLPSCDHKGAPDILDNGGNHATANCVMPIEGENPFKVFTDGMLAGSVTVPENAITGEPEHVAAGRLVCTDSAPCGRTFTLPGFPGTKFNDDKFEDFIVPGKEHLLEPSMFFDVDTYLQSDVSVITPKSILSADIYDSPRFMWVPVIAAPTSSPRAGSWRILTFRPVFIAQDPPTGLESLDAVLEQVDNWVKGLIGAKDTGEDHGLLLDQTGKKLLAVRLVSIEPSALPAVPDEFGGPISDYVGTGVKVIRLVR